MLSPNAIPKGSITQEMIDVSVLDAKQDVIDDLDTIREGAKIGNEAFDIITSMVNAGYLFAGIATPTTGPGTPDAKVFYIANGKGTYTNFGGVSVTEDDVAILYWDSSWHKVSTGIASQEKLTELEETIVGKSIIVSTNQDSWSGAIPLRLKKDIKYKISTDLVRGVAVFAFTNHNGTHDESKEIERINYNAGASRIVEYIPTADSSYIWIYGGTYFVVGTEIAIVDTTSIKYSINKNRQDADEGIATTKEQTDFARLGVGAATHNNPLVSFGSFGVIGDSISTFNKENFYHKPYIQFYPQVSMGITDIRQMYWFKLFNRQGCENLINASYSGSCVTTINPYPDFYARTSVVGAVDTCVVALGSNDSNGQVALGDYDFSSPISSLSESQFIPAYIKGIKNLLAINPKMQIICVAFKMGQAYKEAIKTIAEYFGQFYIDCSTYSTNDNLHPNADGMEQIYDKINAFLVGDNKGVKNDTLKSISTERIPWQFLHSTSKGSQIHFCLGGDEYILAQNTWINEARMGGYAWWMANGKVGKHIPFNIGTDKFKVVVPAWAEMSDDFPASLIVAGQQMYQQYWKIGLINPETGALATSYSLPFDPHMNFVGNVVDGYNHFSVGIKAGRTYKITNNTRDNQIIKISTSLDSSDAFVVSDTDGNLCKKTLVNMGDTFEFTPASNATYIHVYQAKNQGSTECKILFEAVSLLTSSDAVTALCVYDMRDASDVRLFVSSDTEKKIYNIKALDGSDARSYNYPSGVNNICAMCFDEFGKLYVAANDTSLAPYDGNTIYVLDPMRNGTLIGTFVVPRKADGGMEIKDGILYTLDNRTATINKISLGGTCFSVNNMVTPYHLPLSYSFEKRGVAVSGGAGEANVIYDEDLGLFRMWYSRGSIAYCESYNGINWTTPENVIPNASRSHVFKHNGIWHIFYVRTDNTSSKYKEVYHRTSQDGITWGDPTLVLTSEQVAEACANSVWSDFQQFGSVYVTIENGTWKMMMEGRTESDYTWSIGYAESTDGTTWVIDGSSPTTTNHPNFNTGKGQKMIGRTKVFYRDSNGIYWMVCHYSQYLDIPTRIGLAWSTDLKHINILPSSPLLDFTEIEECDQLADAWMMEHDGKLYLYNSCVRNYSPEHSYIRVATLGMSAKDFVESVAIING